MTARNPSADDNGDPDQASASPSHDTGAAGVDTGRSTGTDYRFTLANERTFLAWLRTALGLVAGGVAIQQLVPGLGAAAPRTVLAALCVGLALLVAVASYPRWRSVQRAMARGEPLPRNVALVALSVGIVVITALALVLVVTG